MSGIAFVTGPDTTAHRATVDSMLARMPHRSRDGAGVWSGTRACLGFAAMWTTPEDVGEATPRVGERGWVVAFDGRLDDRSGLARALGIKDEGPDAALVLQAVERWEHAAADHLIGDFALVAWHEARRCALLARDIIGQRPLFYRRVEDSVRAASEIHGLFPEGRQNAKPNLDQLAMLLVGEYAENDETLIEGVYAVPPGHAVVFTDGRQRTERYWDPRELGGGPDTHAAAVDALDDALRVAVEARLRSRRPVTVSVSGGLDSCVIAAYAKRLSVERGDEPPILLTIRFPGLGCDESLFSEKLATYLGLELRAVEATGLEGGERYAAPHPDLYGDAIDALRTELVRGVERDVVLTGWGSDELQWRTGLETHDAVRERRVLEALELAGVVRAPLSLRTWSLLGVAVLQSESACWRRLRAKTTRERIPPDWLTDDAQRRVMAVRRQRKQAFRNVRSAAQASTLGGLTTSFQCPFGRGQMQLGAAVPGFEHREPFFDRRVVELLLSISPSLRVDWWLGKPLTRAVAARMLPASLAYRSIPWTEFSAFFNRVDTAASTTPPTRLRELGLIRDGAKLPPEVGGIADWISKMARPE